MLDWLLYCIVKGLRWIACRLPPSVAVAIGRTVMTLGYWVQPKRATIGYLNLKAAYGDRLTPRQMRRIVRAVFGQLGAGAMELLRLPRMDAAYVQRYIEIKGFDRLEALAKSDRPVILLTGHYGNWELTSITSALKGYPVLSLARQQNAFPRLYALLVSSRESTGCRIVHKGGGMRELIRAVEQRELVGIVGDQANRQGVLADFFGRPALFATGPFALAYSKRALILPSFIHRRHGPYHQIILDAPIDLAACASESEAVQRGAEQFAACLQRHIEEDPTQWLWVHNRWKHSPARRVLVLSDGKLGHVKQSMAVVEAYRERYPHTREQVVEVRYRSRLHRVLALSWSACMPGRLGALACLRATLEPACFRQLATASMNLVVSCGSATAPVNALMRAENRAKSVVIMNPAPLPPSKFTLALIPLHDRVPARANVIQTLGALTRIPEERLAQAREQLRTHARFRPVASAEEGKPWIAMLLGGSTPEHEMTTAFMEALARQLLTICEELDGYCLVTTSRRTPPGVEQWLTAHLGQHPRCRLMLVASRDALNGTLEGLFGWAQVVVVTAESISMVSEACASGRYVVVVDPPRRQAVDASDKVQRYLNLLIEQGYVRHPSLPEVSHVIRQMLTQLPPIRRLDTYATVRDAVARFL